MNFLNVLFMIGIYWYFVIKLLQLTLMLLLLMLILMFMLVLELVSQLKLMLKLMFLNGAHQYNTKIRLQKYNPIYIFIHIQYCKIHNNSFIKQIISLRNLIIDQIKQYETKRKETKRNLIRRTFQLSLLLLCIIIILQIAILYQYCIVILYKTNKINLFRVSTIQANYNMEIEYNSNNNNLNNQNQHKQQQQQQQFQQQQQHVHMLCQERQGQQNLSNIKQTQIQYYTVMSLFSDNDVSLLCKYKYFIQHTIMELGEDWRIESGLLAQEIVSIKNQEINAENMSDFCIFNEFLSSYLKNRIRHEEASIKFQDVQIQENFLDSISTRFASEQNISQSLTFKTLSLGFVITASDVWMRAFKRIPDKQNVICKGDFNFFGAFIGLRQNGVKVQKWIKPSFNLKAEEVQQIKARYRTIQNSLQRLIKLSTFIVHVDSFNFNSNSSSNNKEIRVFRLSNQFYITAFIVWLIYSIKMFFGLSYEDYKRYFMIFMKEKDLWSQEKFDPCLKEFRNICQNQWNNLMKDFSIGVNDDKKVIEILMKRVRQNMEAKFNTTLVELRQKYMKSQKFQ